MIAWSICSFRLPCKSRCDWKQIEGARYFMKSFYELRFFLILWLTQAFSSLGSAMTNFALVLWLYQDSGSALKTAMLTVCSYAPYVLLSIFAGVISDRWNKKAVILVSSRHIGDCAFLAVASACRLAFIFAECLQWADECSAVACLRCCHNIAHTEEILSENQRTAFFF